MNQNHLMSFSGTGMMGAWIRGIIPSQESLIFSRRRYNSVKSMKSFDGMVKVYMGMDQYLLIPFLVGWTSIYQLFWCSPGVQGFDLSPYCFLWFIWLRVGTCFRAWSFIFWAWSKNQCEFPNKLRWVSWRSLAISCKDVGSFQILLMISLEIGNPWWNSLGALEKALVKPGSLSWSWSWRSWRTRCGP